LNAEIQKTVNNKIAQNERIKRIMEIGRKRAYFKNKKNQNSVTESQEEKKHLNSKIFTNITSFAVD